MLGGIIIAVLCFLLLFPVMLMFTSLWASTRPVIDNVTLVGGGNQSNVNHINQLGDGFFFNSADSIIVIMYFALIIGFFISALYENASAASLPIGLLFLIPLILITFPLSDLAHAFYTNPGFANVSHYYVYTEYLSDYSPMITILITVIYLILIVSRKGIGLGGGGASASVVSG